MDDGSEYEYVDTVRVHFYVIDDEARALRKLAYLELRTPRDQVRFMLRQELTRRGLLPVAKAAADDSTTTSAGVPVMVMEMSDAEV